MSENKYLCSPNSDMGTLFDNVFGANFTRALISGETPTGDKWVHPFFTNKIDALMFQDILISQLSIDASPEEKLDVELMNGNTQYAISLSVLTKLRDEVKAFIESSKSAMTVEGDKAVLSLCGLGSAGIPRLYDKFNCYMTPPQIVEFLDELDINDITTLSLYITSNASAAQRHYTFDDMAQLQDQFAAGMRGNNSLLATLIGTKGSLAAEVLKAMDAEKSCLKHDFSNTAVYGYLFPYLTEGVEAYGIDDNEKGLSHWKTMSMAALTSIYTKDKAYFQQVPVRRSLTRVKISSN